MKKVTYREVKANPAHKQRLEKMVCDFCGKEARYKCSLCGCDLCSDYKTCLEYDDRDYGDYPSKYCKPCHQIKFKGVFNDEYNQMQERHEAEEDELDRRVKKAAMIRREHE